MKYLLHSETCLAITGKFFLISLITILQAGAGLFGQTYDVGHFQHTFTDPDRDNRPILTEVYYPVPAGSDDENIAEGSFPLLVFGHGFVMVWSAYENLWTHFVPQGYVMAFPRTEGGFSPDHLAFGLDIAFLTTAVQEMGNDPTSVLYQGLNNKSAVMGHSMGGGASVLAAAQNNNINALLALAPAETSTSAIGAAENVHIPSLIFAGSSDDVTPENGHQIPIYNALASESKSYISISGGGHCYFANFNFNCNLGELGSSGNITITREQQQQTVNDLATPWLNYFLKDDCEAWPLFQDSLTSSPRITAMQYSIIQQPEITQAGETLTATPATSYQWYLDGEPVPDAVNQSISLTQSGAYMVEVSYFNLCTYFSDEFVYDAPQGLSIVFYIIDHEEEAIQDAIIVLNGTEYEPGVYTFEDLPAGSYDYLVYRECDTSAEGLIELAASDINIEILLERIPGDANGDGVVNVLDIVAMVNFYTAESTVIVCFENADVNQDGWIDILDIIATVNIFL